MNELFTAEGIGNLFVLIFLQAVLGFDNLLYISIESKRAPVESRKKVRRIGIIIAIVLRIVLLLVILALLHSFSTVLFTLSWEGVVVGEFNFATLVFLLGGAFIIYTAVKEIRHMLSLDDLGEEDESKTRASAAKVTAMIVLMNLVFSFDSILSAIAITEARWVLSIAIIVSGILMMVMADRVSEFLEKNKQYEVLGLFILLLVGVVLIGEGGHKAGLAFFGHEVHPMSKSTFYFSMVVLVIVDMMQSRYQKRLTRQRKAEVKEVVEEAVGEALEADAIEDAKRELEAKR